MYADQHLLDHEATEALTSVFLDIAVEVGAEDALIYLALASPPAIERPHQTIRSEIASLRNEGQLREDRSASARATHRLQTKITDKLREELDDRL
jgi:hypothetical protein